jgi:hypothetical protein
MLIFWYNLYDAIKNITECNYCSNYKGEGKGKAIPLQAWTCPEGFSRFRTVDVKTADM